MKFNKYKKHSGYDPIINEHIAQLKDEEDKRVKIIKKFYPKEYEEILEESKKEQDTGIVEWTKKLWKKTLWFNFKNIGRRKVNWWWIWIIKGRYKN